MQTSYPRPHAALDFCVRVAHGVSQDDELSESPIAFWHRQSDKLLSFNGAFALQVEYTPAVLLADFRSERLDCFGRLSGRNIPKVHVMPYADSSTYHILWSDVVLVEAGALGATLEPLANEQPAQVSVTLL